MARCCVVALSVVLIAAVHTSPDTCSKDDATCNEKLREMNFYRVSASKDNNEILVTNQGVPIGNNQNTLKAGPRGPSLLEDFIMREKLTHFDHERIPERVVHARGSGAHGVFKPYRSFSDITTARFLQDPNKETPVFVRFSTVAGSKGSSDTVRDIRGFAVKFYTEEGNQDIVGNNAPVFFVQDAMKFPDFVHSVKPEPHNEIPQAGSAHNNFWDFVAQQTETFHALMWAMSDRGIPRSYAMMDGFGVHTFRMINETGHSVFVKFHFKAKLGVHSLVWDEAQKLAGKNADYHRADLWDSIASGNFPEYEMGVQVIRDEDLANFDYDVLDPTKLVPEELVPVTPLGLLTLNRNPDNFFAETEQVAFCVSHIVPGIDFSNDPLMQGRLFSYLDTQLSRLGGPNFHEIPINRPISKNRANNQRDGIHRQTIDVGTTNYDMNTINSGYPHEAGKQGFNSYPEQMQGSKGRVRSDTFSDHFSQATMFWKSMAPFEQDHIVGAFSFELAKVSRVEIRQKIVGHLQGIDGELARRVAANLGLELGPNPHAAAGYPKPVNATAFLSQANTAKNSIKGRMIAILTADGADAAEITTMRKHLEAQKATVKIIAPRVGPIMATSAGQSLTADATISGSPSILFDAVYIPGGRQAVQTLEKSGEAVHYVLEAFVHYKPIAVSGAANDLLAHIGITTARKKGLLPEGIITDGNNEPTDFLDRFVSAIKQHRFYTRDVTSFPA